MESEINGYLADNVVYTRVIVEPKARHKSSPPSHQQGRKREGQCRKRVYIPSAFEAASEENITLGNSHQIGRKRSQSIFDLVKTPGERGKTERPASLRCALTISPDHVSYRTLCHVAISFVFPPSDSYTTQSTWVPPSRQGEFPRKFLRATYFWVSVGISRASLMMKKSVTYEKVKRGILSSVEWVTSIVLLFDQFFITLDRKYIVPQYKESVAVAKVLADIYGATLKLCYVVYHTFSRHNQKYQSSVYVNPLNPWSATKLDEVVRSLDTAQTDLEGIARHYKRVAGYPAVDEGGQHRLQNTTREKLAEKAQKLKRWSISIPFHWLLRPTHPSSQNLHDKKFCCNFHMQNGTQKIASVNVTGLDIWTWDTGFYLLSCTDLGLPPTRLHHRSYGWRSIHDLLSLQPRGKKNIVMAYFYCQTEDPSKTDHMKILGSIVHQLALCIPIGTAIDWDTSCPYT
ncbi:hypothetical protein DFS33DRAFT_1271248 [Desarmillaria ectypa]|nr:hypothetical protein DFS33DRAFT_1271248 [Desarmillaria ectypa]